MFPIPLIALLVVFALIRKTPLNRAIANSSDVTFISVPVERISEYSRVTRPSSKNKNDNLNDIVYHIKTLSQFDVVGLPYMNDFIYLWGIFLAGITSEVISICIGIVCQLPSISFLSDVLYKQANQSLPLAFGVIVAFIRFGITASSNRKQHRYFAVVYSLFFAVSSFFFLRSISLGIFEFRPLLSLLLDVPHLFVDILISFGVGLLAYSLSTPMLYELFAYKMIHKTPFYLKLYPFANKIYQQGLSSLRFVTNFAYTILPLVPIIFYVTSRIICAQYSDLVFMILFVVVEVIIAISKLYYVKSKVQILTFYSLENMTLFNTNRDYQSGKDAIAAIQRYLNMIPVSGISLSLHPFMVIFMSLVFASSFAMNGINSSIARHLPLFIIALMDFILFGMRIFGLFFENN